MATKIRNKEYDARYNEKTAKELNMEFGKANQRLAKMKLFHMAQKYNENICYQCKQKILNSEDLSLEHMMPWRGTKDREVSPDLFWDLNNVSFSHSWCNSGAATRGTSQFNYFGVDEFIDRRKNGEYKKYRGRLTIGKKTLTLGYFKEIIEAAIAYDIGIMWLRDGCGPLNFEVSRDRYKVYLNSRFKKDENIFYKRGPIKDIVNHFIKN